MPNIFPRDPSRFMRKVEINIPGRELIGAMYSTANRRTGRRIVVTSPADIVVFDTGECYDVANCTNKLELWCLDQLEECCHCKTKTGGFLKSAQDAETGHPICDRCVEKTQEGKRDAWLPQATEVSISHEDLEASRAQLAEVRIEVKPTGRELTDLKEDADCPF